MKYHNIANQRGFSLGELGLVLLVVALIAAFAYPKYLQHTESVLAQEESDSITQYVGKFRKGFQADADYSTVTTAIGSGLGYFDPTMIQGALVYNKYQGLVTVVPNTVVNAADTALFSNANYSLAGCQQVVPNISQVSRLITVNGTVVKPLDASLNKATLVASCTAGVNVVTFVVAK